jgi:adenosylcobinamide-phosphate guanylyltransferase
MEVTALVMAGGRGSRLRLQVEKPLLKVGGKPMVQRVVEALRASRRVEGVVVVVSGRTPKTAGLAERLALRVLRAPGEGFCEDVRHAVRALGLKAALVVCADLPLISSGLVDYVVERYEGCGKPALAVMAPLEAYARLGLSVSYILDVGGRRLVPAGVNVVDGSMIDGGWMDEEVLVVSDARAVANVNTVDDLRVVERLLRELECLEGSRRRRDATCLQPGWAAL